MFQVYGKGFLLCGTRVICKLGGFCYLILHMATFLVLSAFPRSWFSYVSLETEI